ncbi:MAG: Crp/Fnr family transcriptional regulator [Lachnospiraceae bacterium]|nr:Crp/Fnr family transcriptional regulator [Lachnospiraceae bacterium]
MRPQKYDLNDVMLFKGMAESEIENALTCLRAREASYKKNEILLHAGDRTSDLGLILEGSVFIENNDFMGNRSIVTSLGRHQFFGEVFASLPETPALVDVRAGNDCRILYLHIRSLMEDSACPDPIVDKLLKNLLFISMNMNLRLTVRSFHTSPRTIRERVLAYLNTVSIESGETYFDIPYDRQALADYLNVDRSALSKELSAMKKDGIIDYQKNHFRILVKTDSIHF